MHTITIDNIVLSECDEFMINKYYRIANNTKKDGVIITFIGTIDDEIATKEANGIFLRKALDLVLPECLLSARSTDKDTNVAWYTRVLFSYFGDHEYKDENIFEITNERLQCLKEWHQIFINGLIVNDDGRYNPWFVAWNEYETGVRTSDVETAYQYLITALEAIATTNGVELSYRTELYIAILIGKDEVDRKEIFELIKYAYNIRSKLVHGDPKGMIKSISKMDVYEKLFKLKVIVSKVLMITRGQRKEDIIESIISTIYKSPMVMLKTDM